MLRPTNDAAEIVEKLRKDNDLLDQHIADFQNTKANNLITISALEPTATWEEYEIPTLQNPASQPEL
jgi:hypothetical protein